MSEETGKFAAAPGLTRLAGMGLELVAAIAGMLLLGWLLDRWLGTGPWLTIAGVAVGAIGGMYNFIRTALRETRRANEALQRKRHPGEDRFADGPGTGA